MKDTLRYLLLAIVTVTLIASPVMAMSSANTGCSNCGVVMQAGCCDASAAATSGEEPSGGADAADDCCSDCPMAVSAHVVMMFMTPAASMLPDASTSVRLAPHAMDSLDSGCDLFRPPCL